MRRGRRRSESQRSDGSEPLFSGDHLVCELAAQFLALAEKPIIAMLFTASPFQVARVPIRNSATGKKEPCQQCHEGAIESVGLPKSSARADQFYKSPLVLIDAGTVWHKQIAMRGTE
jgi:hypothetical protein